MRKGLSWLRSPIASVVASSFLGGCGVSLPQATPVISPNAAVSVGSLRDGVSWMDPDARQRDLLYVSSWDGTVSVYRYWQRRQVGRLTHFTFPLGECVDKLGAVYISDFGAKQIVEYAHGGTKPTRKLDVSPYEPYGCSVDAVTGNVAVAAYWKAAGSLQQGAILVFPHGNGKPAVYTVSELLHPTTCSYDDKQNLLVSGSSQSNTTIFAYLKQGSSQFGIVGLPPPGWSWHAGVQWDGKYWAIEDNGVVYRYRLSGSQGTLEGTTTLSGSNMVARQFWIANFSGKPKTEGTQIVVPVQAQSSDDVAYRKYPAGGDPIGFAHNGPRQAYGVTVSVAAKH